MASGALYFSSAANSGNLTSGTSGTREGDSNAGPASAAPLPLGYTCIFNGAQAYDVLTATTTSSAQMVEAARRSPTITHVILNPAGTSLPAPPPQLRPERRILRVLLRERRICGQQPHRDRQKAGAAQRALHLYKR